MENEEYERLEEIQFLVNEGCNISREDLDWIIHITRRLDTMTNLMVGKLTTPIHGEDWILKYYKEEAEKRICGK